MPKQHATPKTKKKTHGTVLGENDSNYSPTPQFFVNHKTSLSERWPFTIKLQLLGSKINHLPLPHFYLSDGILISNYV
jgi:hypothetical protein